MVIHLSAGNAMARSSPMQQLVESRGSEELRYAKTAIAWSLRDAVVMRAEGLPATQLQKLVRHFAIQRHVLVEKELQRTTLTSYIALAKEIRDYFFAFIEAPLPAIPPREVHLKERILAAGCKIVTLRPSRSLQQLEVLLLSAPRVLGSYEPLVFPDVKRRTARANTRKVQKAA